MSGEHVTFRELDASPEGPHGDVHDIRRRNPTGEDAHP
jgi:hypothetical protein